MPATPESEMRFDWTGFSVLAMALGCLQLMLDRGQTLDWFSSREIIIDAVVAGLGFYLFLVHMFTARSRSYRWGCSRTATSPPPARWSRC